MIRICGTAKRPKAGSHPESLRSRETCGEWWHRFPILVWGKVGLWIDRSLQRRQLSQMSDAEIKDIGLTRADVVNEARKPFWRP
ncbi:MAG: DUF1127 domain-containing protein [Hyphomicrobiaceae bacterium]